MLRCTSLRPIKGPDKPAAPIQVNPLYVFFDFLSNFILLTIISLFSYRESSKNVLKTVIKGHIWHLTGVMLYKWNRRFSLQDEIDSVLQIGIVPADFMSVTPLFSCMILSVFLAPVANTQLNCSKLTTNPLIKCSQNRGAIQSPALTLLKTVCDVFVPVVPWVLLGNVWCFYPRLKYLNSNHTDQLICHQRFQRSGRGIYRKSGRRRQAAFNSHITQ